MNRNLVASRVRLRASNPMRDHDRLPPELRQWAIHAALPWSARSLVRVWNKALRETGSTAAALARLSAVEAQTLARDAERVWRRAGKRG